MLTVNMQGTQEVVEALGSCLRQYDYGCHVRFGAADEGDGRGPFLFAFLPEKTTVGGEARETRIFLVVSRRTRPQGRKRNTGRCRQHCNHQSRNPA